MLFSWIVKHLYFLKYLPPLPHIFDTFLTFSTLLARPQVISAISDIESEVGNWPGVRLKLHKFGGWQFNVGKSELGHIHGNGLVDVRLNRKIRNELVVNGMAEVHHVFNNSGWVSIWLKKRTDAAGAILVFRLAYELQCKKHE